MFNDRCVKEQMKDLKGYEKRICKIIKIDNIYREELLEYLYALCHPNLNNWPSKAGVKPGLYQIPSNFRDKAKNLEKKNEKIEKALVKMYLIG